MARNKSFELIASLGLMLFLFRVAPDLIKSTLVVPIDIDFKTPIPYCNEENFRNYSVTLNEGLTVFPIGGKFFLSHVVTLDGQKKVTIRSEEVFFSQEYDTNKGSYHYSDDKSFFVGFNSDTGELFMDIDSEMMAQVEIPCSQP